MPEIGESGIEHLRAVRVLVVGVGGLGCPSALYLGIAGVGKIGLIDDDTVSASDLGRQALFGPADIGVQKVFAVQGQIARLNPDLDIEAIPQRLTLENSAQIFDGFDVVIDGTDSLGARRIMNLAALETGKPVVFGGAIGWTGFVQTFVPGSACYDCVWTDRTICGSCADVGVLGPLVGTIGTIQAAEAIKVLLGVGRLLTSRMMLFDLKEGTARTVEVQRRSECPSCGRANR